MVLTALYPLRLLPSALIKASMSTASRPTNQLIIATIAVSLLGFFLVPALGRGLRLWLHSKQWQTNFFGATGLSIALFVDWTIATLTSS